MPYNPTPIEAEAIKLVTNEYTLFKEGQVQVTDDVSFRVRDIIKHARKNYWGVFKDPIDPLAGVLALTSNSQQSEKLWVPLTQEFVELFYRSTELSTKDIYIRAKRANAYGISFLSRMILKHYMDLLNIDEFINTLKRTFFIDGTVIIKSQEAKNKKEILNTYLVDNLNVFVDPTDIGMKGSFIERAIYTPNEVEDKPWDNKDEITFDKRKDTISGVKQPQEREIPFIDVYERWGLMPNYLLTGKEEDKKHWIEGVIIMSGLENNAGTKIIHKIIPNPLEGKKPYEVARLKKVQGRFWGIGVPEQIFSWQEYYSEIMNIRRNNGRLLQNGLFEIRVGSGITQAMISRLAVGGAIPVKTIGQDIRQLAINDYRPSSYADEERIYLSTQRVTGTEQQKVGARTPATNAVIAQQKQQSSFESARNELGIFLERVIKNHWLPIIFKSINEKDIVRITGDASELETLDDIITRKYTNDEILDYITRSGHIPTEDIRQIIEQGVKQQIELTGQDRFFEGFTKEMFDFEYDVEVDVSSEKFDRITMMTQLRQMLLEFSSIPNLNIDTAEVAKEILDIMGIGGKRFFKKSQPQQMPQQTSPKPQQPKQMQTTPQPVETTINQMPQLNQPQSA